MYTLMLLDGSELNTPQQREKWGFKTKWRILPRDFVQLRNGKRVLEIEEVVVSSNTLDFGEYRFSDQVDKTFLFSNNTYFI